MKTRKNYISYIRFISTFMIIFYHFSCALIFYKSDAFCLFYDYANGRFGRVGVALFFMISGSGLLLSSENGFKLGQYYKKRWHKIYPMFYLCWVPLYLLLAWKNDGFLFRGHAWKFLFTLLGMDGYFDTTIRNYYIIGEWFLGALIIIYLIFPILRRIFCSKARNLFTIVLFVLCVVNDQVPFWYLLDREWIGYDIFAFWIGMYLVVLEQEVCKRKWILCINAALIFLALFVPLPIEFNCDLQVLLLSMNLYCLIMGISSCFLKRDVPSCIHWVNHRSYPIYLIHHMIILFFMESFASRISDRNEIAVLVFLVGFMLICAAILYRIEKWMEKIYYKKFGKSSNF